MRKLPYLQYLHWSRGVQEYLTQQWTPVKIALSMPYCQGHLFPRIYGTEYTISLCRLTFMYKWNYALFFYYCIFWIFFLFSSYGLVMTRSHQLKFVCNTTVTPAWTHPTTGMRFPTLPFLSKHSDIAQNNHQLIIALWNSFHCALFALSASGVALDSLCPRCDHNTSIVSTKHFHNIYSNVIQKCIQMS